MRLLWFSSTHQKIFCPHLKVGLMNLILSKVTSQRRVLHSWTQSHITGVERHLELLTPVILPASFIEIRQTINILSKSYLEVPGIIIKYATQPFCKGWKYRANLSSPHSQITHYSMQDKGCIFLLQELLLWYFYYDISSQDCTWRGLSRVTLTCRTVQMFKSSS